MNLNKQIEKIIKYSELTSSEFADEIGVQRSNISHILSGRNKPSLDFMIKIKERFPEIRWEWMIENKGEMTTDTTSSLFTEVQGSKINEEKNSPPVLDLFSISSTQENEEIIPNPREYDKTVDEYEEKKIEDSQPLEIKEIKSDMQNTDNQLVKVKKIVFFYENGKFEIFEP